MSTTEEKLTTWKTFWNGFKTFQQTGSTPAPAYPAMRKLFVETNGWFNDIFHYLYCRNKPAKLLPTNLKSKINPGFLNLSDPGELDRALHALDTKGYYIFSNPLDGRYVQELTDWALKTPCILQQNMQNPETSMAAMSMSMSAGMAPKDENDMDPFASMGHDRNSEIIFDANNLIATNYRFLEDRVLANERVQSLMADPNVANLTQRYFRSHAIYTLMSIWWTTAFQCDKPASGLAQLYHFDMDRIKFLKFFCYLTDVTTDDGPHCYVEKSCKRKPKALKRDGRFSDEEMAANYPASDIHEFTAPRGTIIVEDTRGFHKAKMPTKGNRLILEFELASCLFGPPYPKSNIEIKSPALAEVHDLIPNLLSNYTVKTAAAKPVRELAGSASK